MIKRDILNLYKDDIVKYSGDDSIKVQSIFEEIPSQLQNMKKDFRSIQCKKMQDIEIIKMLFSGFKNQ